MYARPVCMHGNLITWLHELKCTFLVGVWDKRSALASKWLLQAVGLVHNDYNVKCIYTVITVTVYGNFILACTVNWARFQCLGWCRLCCSSLRGAGSGVFGSYRHTQSSKLTYSNSACVNYDWFACIGLLCFCHARYSPNFWVWKWGPRKVTLMCIIH